MLAFTNPTANVQVNASLAVPGTISVAPSGDPTGAKDTAAIQGAEDQLAAQGGGAIYFGGTYTVTGLVKRSGVSWIGPSRSAAVLQLAPGVNAPILVSAGFAALTGSGSNTGGISNFEMHAIALDGAKASQTAAAPAAVQIFGYDYTIDNVSIRNFLSGDGLYTEWGLGGEPGPDGGMEARFTGLRVHGNTLTGAGWHHRGPHDSRADDVLIYQNGGANYGFWPESGAAFSAAGTLVSQMHVWGAHVIGYALDAQTLLTGCVAEGASVAQVLVRAGNDSRWDGGTVYPAGAAGCGFQLGTATNTALGFTLGNPLITGFAGTAGTNAAVNIVATGSGRYEALIYQPAGRAVWGALQHDEYHNLDVTGTAGPAVAPLASLGTAPPAIVQLDGSDRRGYLNMGTGAGTSPGGAVQVTFAQPKADTAVVAVFPANAAAAALQPYVASFSSTGFNVAFANAPAPNQPAGTYYVGYAVTT